MSLRGVCLYAVFSPEWGLGARWRRERGAGASLGLYLLRLRGSQNCYLGPTIQKGSQSFLCTYNSTRRDWELVSLGGGSDHVEIGVLIESHLLAEENGGLCFFVCYCLAIFPIYNMTTKSTKGVALRWLPGRTKGGTVYPRCTNVRSS